MPLQFYFLDCWAERLGVMVSSVRDKVVHRVQAEKHWAEVIWSGKHLVLSVNFGIGPCCLWITICHCLQLGWKVGLQTRSWEAICFIFWPKDINVYSIFGPFLLLLEAVMMCWFPEHALTADCKGVTSTDASKCPCYALKCALFGCAY